MNSLAPQFSDPFVGVSVMDGTDYEFRCSRYKKLLAAAQNAIRKLEGELAERDERIDGLEKDITYLRSQQTNALRVPRVCVETPGPSYMVGTPEWMLRGQGNGTAVPTTEAFTRMNVCARGEAEIRDDWNPAKQ